MHVTHCYVCNRPSGFARRLGWGTFFMVLITFGLWLVVIPFYPLRCATCGCTRGEAGPAPGEPGKRGLTGGATPWELIIVFIVVGTLVLAAVQHFSSNSTSPSSTVTSQSLESRSVPDSPTATLPKQFAVVSIRPHSGASSRYIPPALIVRDSL